MEKYIVVASVKGKKKTEAIAAITGRSKEEANEIASSLRNDMAKCAPEYKIFKNIKVMKLADFKKPVKKIVKEWTHVDSASRILSEYGHDWYDDDEELDSLEKNAAEDEFGEIEPEGEEIVSVEDEVEEGEPEGISPGQILRDVEQWNAYLEANPGFHPDDATEEEAGEAWPLIQRMAGYYEDGLISDEEFYNNDATRKGLTLPGEEEGELIAVESESVDESVDEEEDEEKKECKKESFSWLTEAEHFMSDYELDQDIAIAEVITESVDATGYGSYSTQGANSLMTEYGHDWYDDDEEINDLENQDAGTDVNYSEMGMEELIDRASDGDADAEEEINRRERV